jgi:hypothetical protein
MKRRKTKKEEREIAILAVLDHGGFGMWGHFYYGKKAQPSSNIFVIESSKAVMLLKNKKSGPPYQGTEISKKSLYFAKILQESGTLYCI